MMNRLQGTVITRHAVNKAARTHVFGTKDKTPTIPPVTWLVENGRPLKGHNTPMYSTYERVTGDTIFDVNGNPTQL